jgi:hypothetical protein
MNQNIFKWLRAKNIAHQIATGDIVCNLDADNYTGKDFAFYINLTCNQSMDIIGVQKYDKRFYRVILVIVAVVYF